MVTNSLETPRPREVLVYLPNLIAASALRSRSLVAFFVFYILSQLLDMLDGHAARSLNQVSVFGACMDQLTDRLSTCLLYIINAAIYPPFATALFATLAFDVGGHWLHFFASSAMGASSHKVLPQNSFRILREYYSRRVLMALSILGYEAFFLFLIARAELSSSPSLQTAATLGALASAPFALFKILTNFLQVLYGALRLASLPMPASKEK